MRTLCRLFYMLLTVALLSPTALDAADTLAWRAKQDQVDAEIESWDLQTLLTKMAAQTGWQIFFEPGSKHVVSVKFKKLSADQALHRLLGDISYSLTQSNGISQLFVYQTTATAATQLIKAEKTAGAKNYLLANELVIRLKPNSKLTIDELAKLTNAKIIGRDDALRLYRLQFPDEASAAAARELLAKNDSVAWVDSNFSVDRPDPVKRAAAQSGTQFNLNPKAPADGSRIIGLIDTAVQIPQGMEKFALPTISVVGDATSTSSSPTHGTAMFEAMLQTMNNNDSSMILPVDVYGEGTAQSKESTSTYEVAKGIVQAINAGANPISLSLGGTGNSPFLAQLIAEATAKGIVFVAAAGNEPVKTQTYPAAYPGVIAVTASDDNGHIASYANSGDFVKAMAPGTTIITSNGQLWEFQGTSVATAYFSGELAAKANAAQTPPGAQIQPLLSSHPVK